MGMTGPEPKHRASRPEMPDMCHGDFMLLTQQDCRRLYINAWQLCSHPNIYASPPASLCTSVVQND